MRATGFFGLVKSCGCFKFSLPRTLSARLKLNYNHLRGQSMPTPEAVARQHIDELLAACGWAVQDRAATSATYLIRIY
jgi:hypothetical protein